MSVALAPAPTPAPSASHRAPHIPVDSPSDEEVLAIWSQQCAVHDDTTGLSRNNAGVAPASLLATLSVGAATPTPLDRATPEAIAWAFAATLETYGQRGGDVLFGGLWPQKGLCTSVAISAPLPTPSELRAALSTAHSVPRTPRVASHDRLWGATVNLTPVNGPARNELPIASASLHLELVLDGQSLGARCVYAEDTLLQDDADLLCRRFLHILSQAATPTALDVRFPGETHGLLAGQQASASVPATALPLIPALIARVTRTHGTATAVEDGAGQPCSYARLDLLSDHIAASLLAHEPVLLERHVAFMLTKTSHLLPATILAILKAGGCVTPLMDTLPDDRIAAICNDSEAPLWVVDAANAPRARTLLAAHPHLKVELIVLTDPVASALPHERPRLPDLQPHNKAYAIYTSGTTGTPKGVILEHRNLAAFAAAAIPGWTPSASSSSRVLQFSAPIWDVSLGDFIFALTRGATLVLEDRTVAVSDLNRVLSQRRITHATLTPTVASLVTARAPTLEALIVTGEALPVRLRNQLLDVVPALLNGGAPSEVTILALMTRLLPSQHSLLRWTPFGQPLDHVAAVVVDAQGSVAPVGGVGELCLAGEQVSRGYLKRPDETARAFVTLESAHTVSARFYRTGDLARLHANGQFELLGRKDGQFKHRGVRLESDEIVAHIMDCCADAVHPPRRAVVLPTQVAGVTEPLLVACLFSDDHGRVYQPADSKDLAPLHDRLSKRLPKHALPEVYVRMGTVPHTASGKLDARSLKAALAQAPEMAMWLPGVVAAPTAATSPRTPMERLVAAAFANALRQPNPDRLDVDTSYMALGGDSLSMVRILSRLRDRDLFISPAEFMEAATIANVSRVIEAQARAKAGSKGAAAPSVAPSRAELSERQKCWIRWRYDIAAADVEDMYFATHYQSMSSTLGYSVRAPRPQSIEWNQAAWNLTGPTLSADQLRSAWSHTAEIYTDLRMGVGFTLDFRGVVVIYKVGRCPLELETFYPRDDVEFDRDWHGYMAADRTRGYDRPGTIGFRLALFAPTPGRAQKLVISFPHSVCDGWSMALFLNTLLAKLRGAGTADVPSRDSTLFRPFAQAVHARDDDKLLQWWGQELKDLPTSKWPIDFAKTPKANPITDRQYDAAIDMDLHEECRRARVSPFTAMMTAYTLALFLRSGSPADRRAAVVPASYISSGRFLDQVKNLDTLVGPTLDVLLMHARVDESMTVPQLVDHLQTTLNRGRGKEHVSYYKMWDVLGKQTPGTSQEENRNAARGAIQTCLIFQNLPAISEAGVDAHTAIGVQRAEEHMATAACLYMQIFYDHERVLVRTAFDDALVGWDATRAFVDDMRLLLPAIVRAASTSTPTLTVGELLAARPPATTLPRASPVERNDVPAASPSWWLKRMFRNIVWSLWFSWFGALLGLGRA
ncbi:unnamed protein product [Parajaminaea phylloscopi]